MENIKHIIKICTLIDNILYNFFNEIEIVASENKFLGEIKMKILVTGIGGQLGHDVMKVLKHRNIDCLGADRSEFDITDYQAAHKFIFDYKPDIIIHCSAYTAVDKAEDDVALCRRVNAQGTENIAKICREIDAKMVYISTDYVFPGIGEQFYEVEDKTGPTNIYGLTKLEGERVVQTLLKKYFIVRISWVFGFNGNNFVKTMLKLGEIHKELDVVADQIGSPTYTADLAALLCDMVATDRYGIYHVTNEGTCSWAEFATEIFKQAGMHVKVNFITASEYITKARRPANSRMSKDKLAKMGFKNLPKWQNAVARYLKELH